MKKRDFIRLLSLGAAGITAGSPLLKSCDSSRREPLAPYWVWMSARDTADVNWQGRFSQLADLGVRGILIQSSEEGYRELGPLAKSAGLEIHAWIIALNHRNKETLEAHPEWYTVSREGKSTALHPPYVEYYSWLCPTRKEVREFVSDRVTRLTLIEELDGIHLDYIRHSDVILPVGLWSKYNLVQDKEYPEFDFCYCDVCRTTFGEMEGIDPQDLEEPFANQAWLQFRYDSVTKLVNELAVITSQHNKKLTAAVFPTPEIARKLVRQEWTKWNLDAIFPMIYHNFYEEDISWIETATREGVQALNGKFPLYSGLYIPALSHGNIAEAVEFALAGGAAGITFFREGIMNRRFWSKIT
ncbi:MAG: family 10 glycosylhydrolase [Bacteroidales bacterium]|nr:MAG: family 10 glycosylhydrolase [Bacteroidales bacterium]